MADLSPRFRLIDLLMKDLSAEFARDVATGLTAAPKRLSCRYFYDPEGSRLFEAICALPEYYLTRAETAILLNHVHDIAAGFPGNLTVIELGSGNAKKTRLLLEAFQERPRRVRYVPIDICRPVLEDSAATLLREFPKLEIVAVAADYQEGLRQVRSAAPARKLILWLGSNMGNFERPDAAVFLRRLRDAMQAGDRILIGVDLRKGRAVLEHAYDDAAGVTAAFNRNLLARINQELNGDFDVSAFRHKAVYNAEQGRIEMYLVSTCSQRVTIGRLHLEINFAAGEQIHTENSYKYSIQEMEGLAAAAGLQTEHCWQDADQLFSLHLLMREESGDRNQRSESELGNKREPTCDFRKQATDS